MDALYIYVTRSSCWSPGDPLVCRSLSWGTKLKYGVHKLHYILHQSVTTHSQDMTDPLPEPNADPSHQVLERASWFLLRTLRVEYPRNYWQHPVVCCLCHSVCAVLHRSSVRRHTLDPYVITDPTQNLYNCNCRLLCSELFFHRWHFCRNTRWLSLSLSARQAFGRRPPASKSDPKYLNIQQLSAGSSSHYISVHRTFGSCCCCSLCFSRHTDYITALEDVVWHFSSVMSRSCDMRL